MRVLISAYACEPGKGSEPEVGLRLVLAAARSHDVWVLTRENNLPSLVPFLNNHPLGHRISAIGLDLSKRALAIKRLGGLAGMHWYYAKWQKEAGRVARQLDKQYDFDVVHHATFASYWTRAGIAGLDKPFVWGPVGGGVDAPPSLMTELGLSGALDDLAKRVVRACFVSMPSHRTTLKSVDHVFAQNPETARRLKRCRSVSVLPNAVAVDIAAPGGGDRSADIVFVGRLIAWKAAGLAVRTLRYVTHPRAVLKIYGDGPERRRVEGLAARWGIHDRVRIMGYRPREELLGDLATAGVLLHTALREEAGWGVAESLSLGTPIVCLQHGGPPELARLWSASPSRIIPPRRPDTTARALASAVDFYLQSPTPVARAPIQPDRSLAEELLDVYRQVGRPG